MSCSSIFAASGLMLALAGSALTIGSLPLTKKQVAKLFDWGGPPEEEVILSTSRRVASGLALIAFGTLLQIIALVCG